MVESRNAATSGSIHRAIFGVTLELQSPLTPAQCLERLKQNTDSYWRLFGTKPVVGWVRGQKFSGLKRITYRNSFQTRILAIFHASGNGSQIILRFGAAPLVQIFVAIWLAGVLGIGGAAFTSGIIAYIRGDEPKNSWMTLAIPLIMAAFGICLYKFGRWLAREEQAFLLTFIMTTLDARLAD
jgi:hypothetical protein